MARTHDNWERLVAATLRRQEIWELCHAPSISSRSSDFSSISQFPFDISSSTSRVQQPPSQLGEINSINFDLESVVNFEDLQALRPELIFVNGKSLDGRELVILQSCRNPPKKLKPGNYWYDKHAGFWGKKGQKPSQIVSANLDVGGWLDPRASSGNSLVYINGREITKVELRVLKLAGVQCYPKASFWMYNDGSYQEEGSNTVKGSIWGKAGMRLICALFSVPFPSKSSYSSGGVIMPDDIEHGNVKKLLLIGCSGSGASTICTQAKFLYEDIPFFMDDELENFKISMRSNIYSYICILLESCQLFEGYTDPSDEKSIYSSGPGLRAFSDWLLRVLESESLDFSDSLMKECAPLIEKMWRDSAFQETLKRTKELRRLPSIANYFLERAVDVFRPNYIPSRKDILFAKGFTTPFSSMDFSFPQPQPHHDDIYGDDQQDFVQRYRLIRSPPRGLEESNEWLEMCGGVQVVIFSLSLSDYDELVVDDNGAQINKMILDIKYFESVVTHPSFDQTCVLLLLTKYDLFEEKIEQCPLSQCDWLDEFNPFVHRNSGVGSLREKGFSYISVKFKRLYAALTGRKLYVKEVNSLNEDSVDAALRYAKEILKWDEEKNEYFYADDSSFEESSYSEESE